MLPSDCGKGSSALAASGRGENDMKGREYPEQDQRNAAQQERGEPMRRIATQRAAPCRRSAFDGDDVRLNLAVHATRPEPSGDGFGCDVGRFAEPRLAMHLDFAT